MVELPEVVKVGSRIYTVSYEDRLTSNDGAIRLAGCVDHNYYTIRVDPNRGDGAIRETMLHEVLHACLDFCGLENDEGVVMRLSEVMFAVFYDNPRLLELWSCEA